MGMGWHTLAHESSELNQKDLVNAVRASFILTL